MYKVQLPQQVPTDNVIDATAIAILKLCKPGFLDHHTAIYIKGAGNCLFHGISWAQKMYGNETHHLLLRLLTYLKIVQNPDYFKVQRLEIEETTNYDEPD